MHVDRSEIWIDVLHKKLTLGFAQRECIFFSKYEGVTGSVQFLFKTTLTLLFMMNIFCLSFSYHSFCLFVFWKYHCFSPHPLGRYGVKCIPNIYYEYLLALVLYIITCPTYPANILVICHSNLGIKQVKCKGWCQTQDF